MDGVMMRLRDERGITTAVVAVCIVAFIGAAMLTIDAGSQHTTRRGIITGTDSAALDAAQQFNTGAMSPCPGGSPGIAEAETHATNVMTQNNPGSLHDSTETPNGFEVTLLNPDVCNTGGYSPGKVRYDGRLTATSFFSRFFGFGDTKPFSSSTAAWGYIVSIGEGLRPIPICDQSENYQAYVTYWKALHDADPYNDALAEQTYDELWGNDQGIPGDIDASDGVTPNSVDYYGKYPTHSMGYPSGEADEEPPLKSNPNFAKQYIDPATNAGKPADERFHTVHRVISPDPHSSCGSADANGNAGWVDLRGENENGAAGNNDLAYWLSNGYPGEVSLTPQDCNTTDEDTTEDCGASPGDHNALMIQLHELTCDKDVSAPSCPYVFPILVVNCIGHTDDNGATCDHEHADGENAEYSHEAFLFVVLRGFGMIRSNDRTSVLGFDFEFVDVQTSGEVSGSPPPNAETYQTGTQLCGADRAGNHCPF